MVLKFRDYFNELGENPCIWWMNIGVEEKWNMEQAGVVPRVKMKGEMELISGTEDLCLLIADKKDVFITTHKVSSIVTNSMKKAGFLLPKIVSIDGSREDFNISKAILNDEALIKKIKGMGKVNLVPYAVTEYEEKIASLTGGSLLGGDSRTTRSVNSKINARTLAKEAGLPVTEGFVCESCKEVFEAVKNLRRSYNKVVIKDEYGASGKGLYIIDSDRSEEIFFLLLKRKKDPVRVLVERWYRASADINYQIALGRKGDIHFIKPKKQILKDKVYLGSEFPLNDELNKEYEKYALKIGKLLWEKGCRGIMSIDSIVTCDNKIYPCLEINGRFSLSTYTSFLPERFGENKLYKSMYYNMEDEKFLSKLKNLEEFQYTREKAKGIIIYSYGKSLDGFCRVYILYIADSSEELLKTNDCVNRVLMG